jgi:hypothetical protein
LPTKEGVQKEEREKGKKESVLKPKKGGSWLRTVLGILAFIMVLSLLNYESSQGSSASNVHVNGIDYHYYDSQTGANWTYFMPGNYSMAADSSVNGSYPFTSDLNCSMTFTNAYSLTPGFIYQVHGLPLTFFPSTPTDFNITIIAPSHSYAGPLDVKVYVYYTC